MNLHTTLARLGVIVVVFGGCAGRDDAAAVQPADRVVMRLRVLQEPGRERPLTEICMGETAPLDSCRVYLRLPATSTAARCAEVATGLCVPGSTACGRPALSEVVSTLAPDLGGAARAANGEVVTVDDEGRHLLCEMNARAESCDAADTSPGWCVLREVAPTCPKGTSSPMIRLVPFTGASGTDIFVSCPAATGG